MADFKLSAEIEMQAAQALREIDKVKKATKSTEREFNLLGRSVTLDTKRIGSGLKKITGIAGVMFGAIAIASPSMRAAFKQMELAALEMNIAVGEELAPTIEATLVPAINSLRDFILGLEDPYQAWIGLTITLTLVIGLLVVVIAALTVEILILFGVLGIIAGALAAVIVITQEMGFTMGETIEVVLAVAAGLLFVAAVMLVSLPLAIIGIIALLVLLIIHWKDVATVIELIGKGLIWLGTTPIDFLRGKLDGLIETLQDFFDQFGTGGQLIGDFIILIVQVVGGALIVLADFVGTAIAIIGDLFVALGRLLKGDFGGFAEALGNVFIDIMNLFIRTLNTMLVDPINTAIEAIDKVAKVVGKSVNFRIPQIDEIPRFQEGGTVERTGLIFAHRGEEVLRSTEARQFRQQTSSASGGNTYIFNNTYKIGSISNRSQMLAYARESASMQKKEMDRRFHA